MSKELKPGWQMVKFGDVVRNANLVERNPRQAGIDRIVGLEHIDPENLHIKRWTTIEDGTSFSRKFVPGQTLFGKRRAYQKKVAFAEFQGICSGDILTFEAKDPKVLLPELLPFICQTNSFFEYAVGTSAGSLSPRTSWSALKDFIFPLPPREEQKRMAEILWAADEAVESWQDVKRVLLTTKEKVIEDFIFQYCNNEITLNAALDYISDGPFGSNLKTEHYSDSGAIVVRLQNIEQFKYNNSDKAYIPDEYYQKLDKYSVRYGDVLVAGLGDDTYPVGRACLVPGSLGKAINKADCFCLRPNKKTLSPEFLCIYLNSSPVRRVILKIAQGTTRRRINVANLKSIKICIPNLDDQARLVAAVHFIDKALLKMEKNTEQINLIKKIFCKNSISN